MTIAMQGIQPADGIALPESERRLLRRELAWYLAMTFGSAALLAAAAAARGGLSSFPALPLAMLVPWAAAYVAGRAVRRPAPSPPLGLRVGRWPLWIFAPLALLAMWCLVFAISYAVHPAAYVGWTRLAANVGRLRNVPPLRGTTARLIGAYAVTIFLGPVINLPIFLGEEVGWRAFMTPRLTALLGRRGLIVSGCIWALWHTPFILLGHNYPQHPLLGHLLWLPFCVAFGIILQTVYVRSGSIFPAALCHGLTNQFAALTMSLIVSDARFIDLLDGPAGAIAVLIVSIPALVCYRRFPVPARLDAPRAPDRQETAAERVRAAIVA